MHGTLRLFVRWSCQNKGHGFFATFDGSLFNYDVSEAFVAVKKIIALQYLRGIAAMMVVVNHSDGEVKQLARLFPPEVWACGVDLFFIISGFIICNVSYNINSSKDKLKFLLDRILRVVPMYWIFTTINAIAFVASPGLYRNTDFSISHYILSLFFIPHLSPTQSYSPVLRIGWTLNYEMMFYVVFFIAMQVMFRYRAALTIACLLSFIIIQYFFEFTGAFSIYANSIVCEFIYGIIICELYRSGRLALPLSASIACLIIGFGGFIAFGYFVGDVALFYTVPRSLIWGVPAIFVVVGFLGLEENHLGSNNIFSYTGDASYSIYLVHLFPIGVVRTLWSRFAGSYTGLAGSIMFDVLAVVIAWAVGLLVYAILERTIMRLSRQLVRFLFQKKEPETAVLQQSPI